MTARWIRLGPIRQRDFDATSTALAAMQARGAAPLLAWGEEAARYPFALVVPLKFAPGRRDRWLSWGLAAAVATYRQFGVPAYLDGEITLHARRIAQTRVLQVGECAVVASSFLMRFPERCVATPSRELEQAFRLRLEAQHGWRFEFSWPSRREAEAIGAVALAAR
ncbi:MAG TPA: hypothetical protein VF211_01500 [Burkholderiales bacterium]